MIEKNREGIYRILGIMLCLVLLCGFSLVTALAEDSFDGSFNLSQYSGKEIIITETGFKIDGGEETAYTGAYTLTGSAENFSLTVAGGEHTIILKDASINQGKVFSWGDYGIKIASGSVTLSLVGTNTISTEGQGGSSMPIWVAKGTTLTIKGDGVLNALNARDGKASIGAAWNYECGNIIIEDAIINATGGGNGGAVIGESGDRRGNGSIIISGGIVNCTLLNTGNSAIAISGESVKVTSGIVNGTVKNGATLENCIVNNTVYGEATLNNDYVVLEDETLTIPAGASLTISENVNLICEGMLVNEGTIQNNGKITVTTTGSYSGNGIIKGTDIKFQAIGDGTLDAAEITADVFITSTGYRMGNVEYLYTGPYTLSGSTTYRIVLEEGVHEITLNNFSCVRDNTYSGSATTLAKDVSLTLHLAEGSDNTLTGGWEGSGIHVPEGATLTIDGGGILRAGYKSGGNGAFSAAIGGGYNSNFGSITINGGTIYASGSRGASIGSGNTYNTDMSTLAGTININGGIVYADWIGNASGKNGAVLNVNAGIVYCNTMEADTTVLNGIIGNKSGSRMTVYGNATIGQNMTIGANSVLTVPEGTTLTISENIALNIEEGASVLCYGSVINKGTVSGNINGLQAAACVTIGQETVYYANVQDAFATAKDKTATITILKSCDLGESYLSVEGNDTNITLEMAESVVLSGQHRFAVFVFPGASFTMNSGTVSATKEYGIYAHCANIALNGGKIEGKVDAESAVGAVYLADCSEEYGGSTVINGGTFVGGIISTTGIKEALGDGYAYKDTEGNWITESANGYRLYGTVSVAQCDHISLSYGVDDETSTISMDSERDTIIQSCACNHTATAKLLFDEQQVLIYDGTEKIFCSVEFSDNWITDAQTEILLTGEKGCDAGDYMAKLEIASKNVAVTRDYTISKATPKIGTVSANVVENTLEVSAIVLNYSETALEGVFTLDVGQTLVYGENQLKYTFTPNDSNNYNHVKGTVTVMVKDTMAPEISGVEDGKTYNTTQEINVYDINLDSITLNGEPVSDSIILEANKPGVYTIIATDKAGNLTTVMITMEAASAETDMPEGTDTSEEADESEAAENNQVQRIEASDAPKTGDNTNLWQWLMLISVSVYFCYRFIAFSIKA